MKLVRSPVLSQGVMKMVSVLEGEKVEGFDLVLKRGGIITGRVIDSSGNEGRSLSLPSLQVGNVYSGDFTVDFV
jgi:hypothetical protein